MTAVANAAFTAAQFNLNVRDNLNETAPAKATTASSIFVGTGVNSIAERTLSQSSVSASESTSSTSYTDLTTTGPAATVTTGTNAIVFITAEMSNSTVNAPARCSFDVTGATTTAANDNFSAVLISATANAHARMSVVHFISLTPGSNTFTMKYKAASGTATFVRRSLAIIPL
jgi:hypothetical protein